MKKKQANIWLKVAALFAGSIFSSQVFFQVNNDKVNVDTLQAPFPIPVINLEKQTDSTNVSLQQSKVIIKGKLIHAQSHLVSPFTKIYLQELPKVIRTNAAGRFKIKLSLSEYGQLKQLYAEKRNQIGTVNITADTDPGNITIFMEKFFMGWVLNPLIYLENKPTEQEKIEN